MKEEQDPIWLWQLKGIVRTIKEENKLGVMAGGKLGSAPHRTTEERKMGMVLNLRDNPVLQYYADPGHDDRTVVLIRYPGAIVVCWKFADFDKELRRRMLLMEEDLISFVGEE